MINKHNNISSQDALFNNVAIRDTLKSDSIEANQIIRSANPGSTGRIILNGTLTVLGNDNSIDTIKNVNITNNELQFTNETGTTTANKITQENGITNITGGNITFNHTLKVTGDNNNVTTISDANIANNKEIVDSLINSKRVYIFVRKYENQHSITLPFTYGGTGRLTNPRYQENNGSYLFDTIMNNELPDYLQYDFGLTRMN